MLQEDACAHSPCARPHPRKVVAPRGGTPGRGARSVGLKGLPPHGTALLPYENNVGMEVCPLSTKGTERNTISHGLETTTATPKAPGTARALMQNSSRCHTLCSSCVVLPVLKSHAGLLGRSQSMTEKTQIEHGHTSQTHLPADPGNQAAEGGGVVRVTEGETRGQSGKVVGPRTCRDVACFFITNYLIS